MDPVSIKNWYAGLSITNDHFANGVALNKFGVVKSWSRLGQPIDHDDWGMAPQVVNAYYSPSENEIVFPAAIMQFPLYDVSLPNYVNYGGFGSVVGHEISHGFDGTGRQYDADGLWTDWWTNTTANEFLKRADCFIEQYNNYTLTAKDGVVHHGNGELALGENIADSGGVEVAYAAWKLRDMASPDQKLPGLEKFTNDQLFFMFKAPFFCGGYSVEYMLRLMQTDPHPPPQFRTATPMLNSREFRAAYNCPVKEPTCELW
jgi:endothelin-converting enzyme